MGVFDKLFSKKMCDICGADMGIVKDNKLKDGAICKDCASKLSPWFTESRITTLAEIREQLAYREENKAEVAKFNITRTISSDNLKILVDDDAGRLVVTNARNLIEANPDVLDFAQITGCDLDIQERRNEETRSKEGGGFESYNPPRYRVYYDFYILIHVNHRYFNEIRFRINSSSVETTPSTGAPAHRIPDPEFSSEYREYKQMGEEIAAILSDAHKQREAEKQFETGGMKAMKNTVSKSDNGISVKYVFSEMPENAEDLKELLAEYPQTDKYNTAAFFMASLARYVENAEDGLAMIDVLKGPQLLSNPAKVFIKERFMDKKYLAEAYFEGAEPENNYESDKPMTLMIYNDLVTPPDGYSYVSLKTSGADNPRRLVMRIKDGHHYIWEYDSLLMGIRLPAQEDPWL